MIDLNNDSNISNSKLSSIYYDSKTICTYGDINVVDKRPVLNLSINGKNLHMEFDSGASVTVCSRNLLSKVGLDILLSSCHQFLRVANGEMKQIAGKANVSVTLNGKTEHNLELVVVDGAFPALFGRTWIVRFFGHNWLTRLFNLQLSNDHLVVRNPVIDNGCREPVLSVCPQDQVVVHSLPSVSCSKVRAPSDGCREPVLSLCPQDQVVVHSLPSVSCSKVRAPSDDSSIVKHVLSSSVPCCSVRSECDPSVVGGVCMASSQGLCKAELAAVCETCTPDLGKSKLAAVNKACTANDPDYCKAKLFTAKSLESLKLEIPGMLKQGMRTIKELKKSMVFTGGIGLVRDFEAKLTVKEGAKPIFVKSRPLPYALKGRVQTELENMIKSGILVKVEHSDWATPIVVVDNKSKLRICGDYKVTLNRVIETRHYPIPLVEECFNAVAGGTKFTVLDIKKAYNTLSIRECDRNLTTINTFMGLLAWTRLPFGINNSGPIFQETIDNTLKGIPMTVCRVDDILISGRTDEEHLYNLNSVILVLEYQGYKCNWEKSQIFLPKVIYIGHEVSKDGIRPIKSKVEDLMNAKTPKNINELVSFLGAVNYYRRYLPNMSTVVAPLERLRAKEVKWQWTSVEEASFKELKKLLCSERVLTFYDPALPLKLDTDASSVGLGAVLSHIMPTGEEKPIEYISRTLSAAEKNYAQIDKEGLAIVWGVKRFYLYLYGRKFKLVTDHKPLVYIFGANKMPNLGTSRVIRWALFLMEYDFEIVYRKTKDHANCDMLSRLPVDVKHSEDEDICAAVFKLDLENTCVDAEIVRCETKKDPLLSKIQIFILDGWPMKCPEI